MAASNTPAYLEPSALGTKEYWDDAYTVELTNHEDNPDDEGVIWFSDSGAEGKILEYLKTLRLKEDVDGEVNNMENSALRILDLGTGNGHLLFSLRDEGWQAEMVGVDYSQNSIELARRIQLKRLHEAPSEIENSEGQSGRTIIFEQFDILNDGHGEWLDTGFDIVLDKGTFDAISLSNEADVDNRKGCERYGEKAERLVRNGGFLVVTSCNWTEQELSKWFESSELAYHDTIRFPSFTFGGVKGQTVSSVCFRRRHSETTP